MERASSPSVVVVVEEKIGTRVRGGRNFASASESADVRAGQRKQEKQKRGEEREEREGQGAAVSMATRRGGNATVTMAAAGSSLGPTCLSLFLASRPPRSPHLDLFLPPTERRASGPRGRRSSRADPRRRERWGGLGFARCSGKGFFFFSFFLSRFAQPPVNPSFRVREYRVNFGM